MSTFLGLIQEIPGISIDNFDRDNVNSSAFFLSHCHSDHMTGLNNDFFDYIVKKNIFLYCSHLSKALLKNIFSNLNSDINNKCLKELPLDDSQIIDYVHNGNQISISVTCISSGHCPGSVMFLFMYNNKIILYTGDFRINKDDLLNLKSLHYNDTRIPLNINKIYLDTTFLSLKFKQFPCRIDSFRKLALITKEWLQKNEKNIIVLEISANYGSEFIYIELYKTFKKKIHVKDKLYSVYSQIEILRNCVTNIPESTQIHACINKADSLQNALGLKCRHNVDQKNILTIVLSAQKWVGKDTSIIVEQDMIRSQTKNICYSTHASYEELEAFIKYFKPKEIFPCVCDVNSKKEIDELLQKIMEYSSPSDTFRLTTSNYKTECNNFKSKYFSDDEDDL